MQAKLMDTSLLGNEHIEWINDYHATVLRNVGPLLREQVGRWSHAALRYAEGAGAGGLPSSCARACVRVCACVCGFTCKVYPQASTHTATRTGWEGGWVCVCVCGGGGGGGGQI